MTILGVLLLCTCVESSLLRYRSLYKEEKLAMGYINDKSSARAYLTKIYIGHRLSNVAEVQLHS